MTLNPQLKLALTGKVQEVQASQVAVILRQCHRLTKHYLFQLPQLLRNWEMALFQ